MKKILILGAGEMQVPVIQKVKQTGMYAIVADYADTAPGFIDADKKYLVSTVDFEALLKIAQEEKIDGILTTSDYPVNIVARISRMLGLSAMSPGVAEICTNKYLQRTLFSKNGIRTPFFRLCENTAHLSGLTDFPYVVKPVDSSASRGVVRVNNAKELSDAFHLALTYSRSKKVLVESFIEGREFSVETYTQKGKTDIIAITEKLIIGEDYGAFVEDTHIEPARLTKEEDALIRMEVIRAIQVSGLDNSPSHTEVKLSSGEPYIIEIACRLGGDYITSDLVPLSTGVDMLENLIKVSIGEKIEIKPKWKKVSCVQFLNPWNYYRCADFIRRGSSAIVRYEQKPFSERIIKNSLDRLGYILLQTDTLEELECILKEIK
ncbi:ATP-grasp domain-containing protein [Odoribacter splanchnicus]|jgi:phosphoribosylglycinamide synthetase, ATP-grasp (A) domain|uniref:ATP-grasp domain-containing protein n=1 Tax=Odoribacter splanchnicus TaxID=28118 RepID=A0AAW5CKG3_9BACT|nr:ATP-grasp domain-containing protein [Odoribacter splanchnicus]MBV4274118.1 ATP-grasp domain-containing protein [Odoribacter splanchnicus]MBV4289760.1 ATP-grasp domain-containing protein [Odoribacter splanchnicus]MBV4402272.1 ATP-grasp domain-containing protein [Odoribacter splanchnicus]MBV4410881.1 ATP-grasp domain-containing protein [Odoribacter splanchnicus]MCG4962086.1 ATP-grasp domain-containing protein [Odoribacter splanchnicus]